MSRPEWTDRLRIGSWTLLLEKSGFACAGLATGKPFRWRCWIRSKPVTQCLQTSSGRS